MRKLILAMLVLTSFTLIGFVGQASAVPTIDGIVDVGEWVLADLHTFSTDPNEGDVPNEYDIAALRVLHVDTGGADDGLYFRIDMYDTPTTAGGPGSSGDEAFVRVLIDFDGDGDADFHTDFNGALFPGDEIYSVYSGTPALGTYLGNGDGAIGDVFEFFLPESFFDVFFEISPSTGFRVRSDNNGTPADDFLPNEGFTTGIPEPSSIILIGSGILGLAGIRRRFNA
ncbi:MAG: PEP-CTERM sorting domain-containing protein [Candidatus Omnitrophica bacterium]|nr:PEP-CTERM sorting domain-containing protein [Candidatus Omnitrophota bacterium]